jgi:hypothetical protein
MPKKPGFLSKFKVMMQCLSKKTRFLPQLFQYIKVRAIALLMYTIALCSTNKII